MATISKTCSVEGCNRPVNCRGLCAPHVGRLRKNGDVDASTPIIPRMGVARRGAAITEYIAWQAMKRRCLKVEDKSYPNYGGRGISICDRWLFGDGEHSGSQCFLMDMGKKPDPSFSIDRINGAGNYEPGNCRWASRKTQNRNRSSVVRVSFNGRVMCVAEAARAAGISPYTVRNRINALGWSVEEALNTPSGSTRSGPKSPTSTHNESPSGAAQRKETE